VKIRQKKYPSGIVKWQADRGVVNGRRIQKYFSNREDAENFARSFNASLREDGIAGYSLSPHERVLFTTCRAKLAAAGATILEATIFYLTHHRPLLSAPDLIQIAQEFLEEQRRINSPKYVEDLQKPNLEGFIRFLRERDHHPKIGGRILGADADAHPGSRGKKGKLLGGSLGVALERGFQSVTQHSPRLASHIPARSTL
jgi:hypothetical protein